MLKEIEVKAESTSFWKKLGKVKLGLKERARNPRCGKQHQHTDDCYAFFPKDVNYFVMDPKWHGALGAQPRSLEIQLAYPTLERNFDVDRAVYRANGTKFCFSKDGVTARRMVKGDPRKDDKTGEMVDTFKTVSIPCLGDTCEYAKKCPKKGGFEFMIPACGEVGTFYMKTGSMTSASQMLATLRALENFTQGRPHGLHGIRMNLSRELVVFNPDIKGDGNPVRIEKYVPKLEIDYKSLRQADQELLGPIMGKIFALPTPTTAEDINTEDDEEDLTPAPAAAARPSTTFNPGV